MDSNSKPDLTIVTACDRNYLWGACLLAASAARWIPEIPLVVWQSGFSQEDCELINQYPNVQVRDLAPHDHRSVAVRKPEALLQTETEFVAWMDVDCFIIGNIHRYLIPDNQMMQIRFRGPEENANVWRNHYQKEDHPGAIPLKVLNRWRTDINGLKLPRFPTTCVTNCFVFNQKAMGLIQHWHDQLVKVLGQTVAAPVDYTLPEYFMTDESVLSSLLCFAEDCPEICRFQLGADPSAHVAHFGAQPKPWKNWRKQSWYTRDYVIATLEWAQSEGYRFPPIPPSLKNSSTLSSYCQMWALELKSKLMDKMSRRLRRYS